MKLYEYTEQFAQLKTMFDDGEMDPQLFQDTYNAIEMDADEKAENTVKYLKQQDAEIAVIKEEIKRLSDMKKRIEQSQDWLTQGLENYYISKGNDPSQKSKMKIGTFEIGFKNLPVVVDIEDEMELPEEYLEYTPKPMKAQLKKVLQDGIQVPGAKLSEGRTKFYVK